MHTHSERTLHTHTHARTYISKYAFGEARGAQMLLEVGHMTESGEKVKERKTDKEGS